MSNNIAYTPCININVMELQKQCYPLCQFWPKALLSHLVNNFNIRATHRIDIPQHVTSTLTWPNSLESEKQNSVTENWLFTFQHGLLDYNDSVFMTLSRSNSHVASLGARRSCSLECEQGGFFNHVAITPPTPHEGAHEVSRVNLPSLRLRVIAIGFL